MTITIVGRALHKGTRRAPLVVLDEPLSFWGGFDPATGMIIDRAHPQSGQPLANVIVAMPGSRGSSSTPGVLGESLRRGTGPAGFIVTKADINLAAGAMIAQTLYEVVCPIVLVGDLGDLGELRSGTVVELHHDGSVTFD